uniref:hypothetical protein n=1 Tax=Brevibacillus daliensis TaxID=2892995 RepID=UPI001E2C6B6A
MKSKLIDMDGVPVISLPSGYDLLETFIGTNLQEKDEKGMWVIDSINEILRGKVTNTTLSGVKYHVVELSNTTVRIIDPYSDDGACCELLIDTFKSIIVNWLQQKDKYYGLNSLEMIPFPHSSS